jgi:hypothetical protein
MSSKAASLFHQAAQLSDAECAELYEKLGMRLGKTNAAEPELPDGLADTLDRRWEEIVSGRVVCRDAFEALDEIEQRFHEKFATAS